MLAKALKESMRRATRGPLRHFSGGIYNEAQMSQLKLEEETTIVSKLIELIAKKKTMTIGPETYRFSAKDMDDFSKVISSAEDFEAYSLILYRYVKDGNVVSEEKLDGIVRKGVEVGAYSAVIELYSVHLYLRYFPKPEITEAVWLAICKDEKLKETFAYTLLKNLLVKRSQSVANGLKEFETSFKQVIFQGREASRAAKLSRKSANAQKSQTKSRR